MANINIVTNNNLTNLAQGVSRPAPAVRNTEQARPDTAPEKASPEKAAPEKKQPIANEPQPEKVQRETPAERQERIEKVLENVISVSKDGDTVQASEKAVQELDEDKNTGRVLGNADNDRIKKEQEKNGSDTGKEMLEFELERSAQIRREQIEAAQEEAEARREERRLPLCDRAGTEV